MRAITATNANLPAGRISTARRENLVRIEGKMKEAADFKRIIVAAAPAARSTCRQVAEMVDGAAEETSISRVNGVRAISLEIAKVQDANTVQVGTGVKMAIEADEDDLPKDVEFRVLDDSPPPCSTSSTT
jgi:multidrug efflux pump subunit AcrB